MAKFFKYKSTADLQAENTRLGVDIRCMDDFSPLFQPLAIGTRTVGNRWCIHPMEGCDGELDGRPGELTFRRYTRFGDGGAKLIWGEACAVVNEGRANTRQIVLNPATKTEFHKLVDQTHLAHRKSNGGDGDLLFGLQLTHSGRYSHPRPILATRDPLLDSRTVWDKTTGEKVNKSTPLVTDDQLKKLVDHYVAAAKLAQDVGFDFVDVKQCHRYLLNELLGARNRPGPYGGSYENRTRLAREIFQAIRAACPKLILATRLNVFDSIPFHETDNGNGHQDPWTAPLANGWGMSESDPFTPNLMEPLRWIADMRKLGVVMVNVTLGNPYAQPHFGRPFEYPPPDGYDSPEHPLVGVDRHFRVTEAITKANPGLAIVGTGYSYLQEFLPHVGAANLRDGRVSLVGIGRASLSQPDLVRLLRDSGKMDRKRICRTFSTCTALMRAKNNELGQFPTGCPPFDKDPYDAIWKSVQQLEMRKD
jgi:2,4-dienoyl-CoA reductase-like NADH-dependent reductase (Old Yellow Enzyme family)